MNFSTFSGFISLMGAFLMSYPTKYAEVAGTSVVMVGSPALFMFFTLNWQMSYSSYTPKITSTSCERPCTSTTTARLAPSNRFHMAMPSPAFPVKTP